MQSATSQPPREAQTKVDREQARMLVATLGYEEASKRTGIKAATLRKWNERYQWKVVPTHALSVTNVTKPADALVSALAEDSRETKVGFSRAARKVSTRLSGMDPDELTLPEVALSASKWHGIAEGVHKWNQEERGSGVLGGLQVYSQQTVIQVGVRTTEATQSQVPEETGDPSGE